MFFRVFSESTKDQPKRTETDYLVRFCKSMFVVFIIPKDMIQLYLGPYAKHDDKGNGNVAKQRLNERVIMHL